MKKKVKKITKKFKQLKIASKQLKAIKGGTRIIEDDLPDRVIEDDMIL